MHLDYCRQLLDQPRSPDTWQRLTVAAAGLDSSAPKHRPILACVAIHRGDLAGAMALLSDPVDPAADQAHALFLLGREADGRACLFEALHDHTDASRVWRLLADSESRRGDFPAALQCYRRACGQAPNDAQAWLGRTQTHLKMRQLTAAEESLAQLPTLDDPTAEACIRLQIQVQQGLLPDAEHALEAAFERASAHQRHRLLASMADALAQENRTDRFTRLLQRLSLAHRDDPAVLEWLARSAYGRGQPHQTIFLIKHLLTQQPDNAAGLYVQLSRCFEGIEPAEAVDWAARAAEAADTGSASLELRRQIAVQQARASHTIGQNGAAIGQLEALLEADPWCADALAVLGHWHLERGERNAARQAFKRLGELQPLRADALLMQLREFPKAHADLTRLEAWARQPDECGQVRADVLLGLAAAWEAQQDYARAFALATRANAAIRPNVKFDPELQRQRHQRLINVFTSPKSLPPARAAVTPLFIVGMPGAGVSWLTRMLAQHPKIVNDTGQSSLAAAIEAYRTGAQTGGRARRYPEGLNSLDNEPVLALREQLIRRWRSHAPSGSMVLDGTPMNYENIGLIKMIFPEAKIITLQRDPRAVTLANFFTDYPNRAGDMAFAYDLPWIGAHLAHHLQLMSHWRGLFPGQLLDVDTDRLTSHLRSELDRVFRHIGVAAHPDCVSAGQTQATVSTHRRATYWQGDWRHYQSYLGPLYAKAWDQRWTLSNLDSSATSQIQEQG